MLQIAPGVRVYLACRPVDMRRGFDGLSADVTQVLKADPFSGGVFVFRGKRGDYLKILTWDGSGFFSKLLEWNPDHFGGNRRERRGHSNFSGSHIQSPLVSFRCSGAARPQDDAEPEAQDADRRITGHMQIHNYTL